MKFKNNWLNKKSNYFRYLLKPNRINTNLEKKDLKEATPIILPTEVKRYFKKYKVALVKDTDPKPYYTKFERFLKNNDLDFEYYNIFDSTWQKKADQFDIIIWRPMSYYWEIQSAREKIFFLNHFLNKITMPSLPEIMLYENKAIQYYLLKNKGYPLINTFNSYDYDECLKYIESCDYPLVSKTKLSSGSTDITLLKNKSGAKRLINKVFKTGQSTYWPFLKQKNYIIFQDYLKNYGYDLRIIVIDSQHIFGYYRHPKKGDFRASGSSIIIKQVLPIKAVEIAFQLFKDLDFNIIAVDFLKAKKDDNYYISELSFFVDVITCIQAEKEDIAGRYIYNQKEDRLEFKEGKFWLQELILNNFFIDHYQKDQGEKDE